MSEPDSQTLPQEGLVRRTIRDLGWYGPTLVLSTVLNLVSVAVFTRLLDKTRYGTYTLVLSGVLLLAEFAFGGVQASAMRYWHVHSTGSEEKRERFLASLLVVYGLVTLGCAVVWPFLGDVLFPGIPWRVMLWGLPLLVAQCASRLVQTRTRAVRELRAYFLYSILPMTLSFVLGIVLVVSMHGGAAALLAAQVAGNLIALSVELVRRLRNYVPARFVVDRARVKEILAYGLPIVGASVGGVILEYSDRFLVAHYFDVATAGVYIVGYQLGLKIEQVSLLMIGSAFPLLVQDYESRSREDVGKDLRHLISVFFTFFAPMAAGMALVAHPLVKLLLGRDFQPAADYMVPLMPGVFFMGLNRYLTKPFQLRGNNTPFVLITTLGAGLNVGLNVLLLPRFGPVVASWTTTAGMIVVVTVTYPWSRRMLPYSIDWWVALRVALATALMCAAVIAVGGFVRAPLPSLLVRMAVGGATYGVAGLLLDLGGARGRLRARLGRGAARRQGT